MSALVCVLSNNITIAQHDVSYVEKCGQALITSEELKDEKFARSYFALQDAVSKRTTSNEPKTIPTIIHVILDDLVLTEADIEAEFDYLNLQFELNNANVSFCLSEIRFYDESEVSSWCSNPAQCYASVQFEIGEYAPNENSDIMEVYIGQWTGSILGFTSLPPAWVGVWVRADQILDADSKTMTHEAGHWCGLLHTFSKNVWGQNYSCTEALNETDCENQGDKVCDTPATAIDWSCNDACPDIDEVDESYMSYAPDWCQDLFTQDQINRMHVQLELGRSDAINNDLCSPCDLGDCPWDFNGNGLVDVQDLMTFLSYQSQYGECLPADFNGDNYVDVNDLNEFLLHWDTQCGSEINVEIANVGELLKMLDQNIIKLTWSDIAGRTYSKYGDLAPGFYIQIEEYIDGTKLTRKILIRR